MLLRGAPPCYSARTADDQGAKLLDYPRVRDAIQAEMRATAIATKVTKAFLVRQTLEIVGEARAGGARNVALRGLELLAKMGGHIVDKCDIRVITSWEDLSDDELRALAGPEPPGDDSAKGQS